MEAIRHEVWINADSQAVFEAISSREGLDSWWGKALSAEPGVGCVIEFDHGLGDPLRMRITDLDPGARLTWRCVSDFSDPGNPASEWLGHRLGFDLKSAADDPALAWMGPRLGVDGGTILRFSHTGWTPESRWFAFSNTAWGVTLEGLASRFAD